jgi:hypothetical protein
MIKEKAEELSVGQTDDNTLVIGKQVNSMVKEHT